MRCRKGEPHVELPCSYRGRTLHEIPIAQASRTSHKSTYPPSPRTPKPRKKNTPNPTVSSPDSPNKRYAPRRNNGARHVAPDPRIARIRHFEAAWGTPCNLDRFKGACRGRRGPAFPGESARFRVLVCGGMGNLLSVGKAMPRPASPV